MFNSPSTSYGSGLYHNHFPRLGRSGSGDSSSNSSNPSNSEAAISVIEFGELSDLPPQSEILKTLECPICKEIPFPPIFNCLSGHSVCGNCRPKLAHCCLCKANYTEARNYSLESLVLNSKFYCHYKSRGCCATIPGENFREHLRNCTFRPGVRPLPQCQVGSVPRQCTPIPNGNQEDDDTNWDDYESSASSADVGEFEVVNWVKCKNGQYPLSDGVVAGLSAGSPVFVARAYQGSRLILGRLIPNERAAYVYWHGCQRKWYYEILVAVPGTVKWVEASWGDVPAHAVSGGMSPDSENVYIGRAIKNGSWVPGMVQPSSNGCYVGVEEQLYLCHDYEVLVIDI